MQHPFSVTPVFHIPSPDTEPEPEPEPEEPVAEEVIDPHEHEPRYFTD